MREREREEQKERKTEKERKARMEFEGVEWKSLNEEEKTAAIGWAPPPLDDVLHRAWRRCMEGRLKDADPEERFNLGMHNG